MPIIKPIDRQVNPASPAAGPRLQVSDFDPGFGAEQAATGAGIDATRRSIAADAETSRAQLRAGEAGAEATGAWGNAGKETAELASTLAALDQQATKARRAAKLADVKARYTQKKQEFAFYLQNGDGTNPAPPAEQHLAMYDKNTAELYKSAEKEFGDDKASFAAFRNEFSQVALNKRLDVLKHVVDQKSSDAIADVENGLRTTAFNVAGSNPRSRAPLIASAEQSVFDLEHNGVIDGEKRNKLLNAFYKDTSNADAMRMIREDPWRAEKFLQKNRLAGWDVDTQEQWVDKARRGQEHQLAIQSHQEAEAKRQLEEEQKGIQNDLLGKLDKFELTPTDVLSSKLNPFGSGSKEAFLQLIKTQDKLGETIKTDPATFERLYNNIHLPEDNPQKLRDENVLNGYFGKGLNLQSVKDLRAEIQGRRTEEGQVESELKKGVMDAAKTALTGSNELVGIRDPIGDEQLQKFRSFFLSEYPKLRKEGKSAKELTDPDSPSYLGKAIARYKRTPQQMMADMTNSMKPAAVPEDEEGKPKKLPPIGQKAAELMGSK